MFCNTIFNISGFQGHDDHAQTNNSLHPPSLEKRRRILREAEEEVNHVNLDQDFNYHYRLIQYGLHAFLMWLSIRDLLLLQLPTHALQLDVVVAMEGSGK